MRHTNAIAQPLDVPKAKWCTPQALGQHRHALRTPANESGSVEGASKPSECMWRNPLALGQTVTHRAGVVREGSCEASCSCK
eukprot:6199156-Pleurochrysis_carterae.AAC.5